MQTRGAVVDQYLDFLPYCDSPCFADWTRGVLDDQEVLDWLETLPPGKAQPNLVFAAARWHGVAAPGPYTGLREALLDDDGTVRRTILTRATQTNEVGRLATLTPLFAEIADGDPLALIEVGASAGLCLYPDRWGYRWQTEDGVRRAGPASPALGCAVTGPAPLPAEPPSVGWRAGVDLNPLDVTDDDQMDWLTTLVWPEHDDRRETLRLAVQVVRADPPALVAGDLLEQVPALVESAAGHGRVVVFHSAVISYLDDADRDRFEEMALGLVGDGACRWVSNEGASVLPRVADRLPCATSAPAAKRGQFLLALDGVPRAWTHGHGRSLSWLPPVDRDEVSWCDR